MHLKSGITNAYIHFVGIANPDELTNSKGCTCKYVLSPHYLRAFMKSATT